MNNFIANLILINIIIIKVRIWYFQSANDKIISKNSFHSTGLFLSKLIANVFIFYLIS